MNVAATARIVFALDPAVPLEIAFEIARFLPQNAAGELLGLFVEDARLLAHAGSRHAREVVLSGLERPLERRALERQLQAQAEEQRRRFESAAARLGLRHEFRVARGEWLVELVREATNADALVVTLAARTAALHGGSAGVLRQLAHAPLRSVLIARECWSTGNRVVALLTAAHDAPVLHAALRFARASRSPLTVLLGGAATARAAEIEAWLATQPVGFGPTAVLAAGELGGKLPGAARDARLVVLPAPESPADDALFETSLATRVPLLIVREEGSWHRTM